MHEPVGYFGLALSACYYSGFVIPGKRPSSAVDCYGGWAARPGIQKMHTGPRITCGVTLPESNPG